MAEPTSVACPRCRVRTPLAGSGEPGAKLRCPRCQLPFLPGQEKEPR